MAALVNMAYAGSGNGHDQEGMQFLQAARSMAERLGLDDKTMSLAALRSSFQNSPVEDDLRFQSHVAWGYFIIVKCAPLTTISTSEILTR